MQCPAAVTVTEHCPALFTPSLQIVLVFVTSCILQLCSNPPPPSILPRQCCCPYLQQAARGAQQGSLTDSTLPGTPAGKTVSSALHTSACSVDQHIYSLPHPLPHFYRIFRFDQCRCTLNQLCSAVEQSDDLRAQALYECSVFDTVLDTGL